MEPFSFPSSSKYVLESQWHSSQWVRTEFLAVAAGPSDANKKMSEKKQTRRGSRGKNRPFVSIDGVIDSPRNLTMAMENLSLNSYSQPSTSKNHIFYNSKTSYKKGNPSIAPPKANKNLTQSKVNLNATPSRKDIHNSVRRNSTPINVPPKQNKNVIQKGSINTPTKPSLDITPKKVVSPMQAGASKKSTTKQKQINVTFTYSINIIKTQKYGEFIRKRNTNYKYVNLKSFGTNNIPHIFYTTPEALKKLIGDIKKRVTDRTKPKSELRKYPKDKIGREKTKSISQEVDLTPFPDYMSKEDVETGLANGTLIRGFVRINPKNFKDSYVSNEDTTLADYYLTSLLDRNRALEGDEVVLQLKPESEWLDGQKTARVVFIKDMVHSRVVIGSLKPSAKKNSDYALLHPRDKRCPLLRIPETNLPNFFKEKPDQFDNIIFVAKILKWNVPMYAQGVITENLGEAGDLKVETTSILREFRLDTTPFSKEMTESLPLIKDIPEKELEYREDLRKECIFTIDPQTARDLDDAVSVKQLANGNFEVGVHISDASFFLEEGTELDQMVSKKATTIYLVDNVFHMLPVELCLNCSLLPGEDKLSFSVIWEMTEDAEIVSKRFTRSIMNSCTKLAYEHAQNVIENPDKEFTTEDFPTIHNGFTPEDIIGTIKILQKIAVRLREKRIENGALRIDQVKLLFNLDPNSGEPIDFSIYENKEAHRLIEEFMLLANITVAERIKDSFPNLAFLRCHEPPKKTMLTALKNSLAYCGIDVDISSSKAICSSVQQYSTGDYSGLCRSTVLNHLTAKAMTRARYFCAAAMESEDEFKHYALSVPIYTHFTSPIRRYADIMVHRLLAASLEYQEAPKWDVDFVSAIAANCNAQKYNAKRAGEASAELFLGFYIEKNQPFDQDCVVVDIKQRSFDVIVLKTGSIVRIYPTTCESKTIWKAEALPISDPGTKCEKRPLKLTITFPKTKKLAKLDVVLEIFSVVKIRLARKQKSYKLEGTLLRPVTDQP
nr:unnamed protein product [Callosobruchus chinensis]